MADSNFKLFQIAKSGSESKVAGRPGEPRVVVGVVTRTGTSTKETVTTTTSKEVSVFLF